jgi:hypothetical protein
MNFNAQKDPLNVLSSTKPYMENPHFVRINEKKIKEISLDIKKRLEKGLDMADTHFGPTKNLAEGLQLIFLEDTVNFCFWAEKNKPKWEVEWPKGNKVIGGWFGLTTCFQRAIIKKTPILDSDYLIELDIENVKELFESDNGTKIPLIEKRLENLKEAGDVLKKKFSGQFLNVLEEAKFDAISLVRIVLENFPSFRDIENVEGKTVYFLKRAQILAQDVSYLKEKFDLKIKNVDLLTGFADYKIPQMLRKYGVISYTHELADRVDNFELINRGSREEIEIRSATIWCIELIRQILKKYNAGDIDNALWLISQDQTNVKPYHRTYTIYY